MESNKQFIPKQKLIEGGEKWVKTLIKPKERRVECGGDCGRKILMFYNPEGYCRKCLRQRRRRQLRNHNRRMRGTL